MLPRSRRRREDSRLPYTCPGSNGRSRWPAAVCRYICCVYPRVNEVSRSHLCHFIYVTISWLPPPRPLTARLDLELHWHQWDAFVESFPLSSASVSEAVRRFRSPFVNKMCHSRGAEVTEKGSKNIKTCHHHLHSTTAPFHVTAFGSS